MRINKLAALPLLSILLLGTFSCDRSPYYLPVQNNVQFRIQKIHFERLTGSPYMGQFYYNKKNDPDSVLFQRVCTGSPNLYFYYDQQHKLRELKAVYTNNTYETWHFYTWQGQRIVADTVYAWGQTDTRPAPGNYHDKWLQLYTYDSKGRITKVTFRYLEPFTYPDWETTYSYDVNGNLDKGPAFVYDNYRNPLSLHPLWQFLTRNYSVNNACAATQYDQLRLPLQFDLPYQFPPRMNFLIGNRWLDDAKIDYEPVH